jgi:hypothetical protein
LHPEPAYSLKISKYFTWQNERARSKQAAAARYRTKRRRETKDSKNPGRDTRLQQNRLYVDAAVRDWLVFGKTRWHGLAAEGRVNAEKTFNSEIIAEQQAAADALRKN